MIRALLITVACLASANLPPSVSCAASARLAEEVDLSGQHIHVMLPDGLCMPMAGYGALEAKTKELVPSSHFYIVAFSCSDMKQGGSPLTSFTLSSPSSSLGFDAGDRQKVISPNFVAQERARMAATITRSDRAVDQRNDEKLQDHLGVQASSHTQLLSKDIDAFGAYSLSKTDIDAPYGSVRTVTVTATTIIRHRAVQLSYSQSSLNNPAESADMIAYMRVYTAKLARENPD